MKKTIRKPENWQDFESLCKTLWGEIWSIPMKIKKNGRNGQPQAGVDVYGVPKGEFNYWGIQCKGKDDSVNVKLTKKEIDIEIGKAKMFEPKLEVFIFATSMNKDSGIEEYVRLKDLESRGNGSFEILLFCWEDIADLLEENTDTLNTYLTGNSIRNKYDLEVYFSDFKLELNLKPKFLKKITKYKIKEIVEDNPLHGNNYGQLFKSHFDITHMPMAIWENNKVNRSWCKLEFVINNCGSMVFEDWRVRLRFDDNIAKIDDDFSPELLTPPSILKEMHKNRTTYAYPEDNLIVYYPREKEPLIQKDNAFFKAFLIPKVGAELIHIQWELLARDFNKTGDLTIRLDPDYKEEIEMVEVDNENSLLDEIVEIKELIEMNK